MMSSLRAVLVFLGIAGIAAGLAYGFNSSAAHETTYQWWFAGIAFVVSMATAWMGWRKADADRADEAAAQARVKDAAAKLAISFQLDQGQAETPPTEEQPGRKAKPDLTLPALWEYTESRLDLYHKIATSQARRSFFTAQIASGAGFGILVYLAILAANTKTTTGAITTGALGAVSAALAGYISRTFVQSQQSAAEHLRSYFEQPLEFSKYLAAERLLANNPDLESKNRAAILTGIVQAVVAPGQESDWNGAITRNGTRYSKDGRDPGAE